MPRGRKHLTHAEKQAIIRDYQAGVKFEAIAAAHNISDSTLDRLCKKMGVKQRGFGKPRKAS